MKTWEEIHKKDKCIIPNCRRKVVTDLEIRTPRISGYICKKHLLEIFPMDKDVIRIYGKQNDN